MTDKIIPLWEYTWQRAEAAKKEADEGWLEVGKMLIELKARAKEEGHPWCEVCKRLGRAEQRANELIRLARRRR